MGWRIKIRVTPIDKLKPFTFFLTQGYYFFFYKKYVVFILGGVLRVLQPITKSVQIEA